MNMLPPETREPNAEPPLLSPHIALHSIVASAQLSVRPRVKPGIPAPSVPCSSHSTQIFGNIAPSVPQMHYCDKGVTHTSRIAP